MTVEAMLDAAVVLLKRSGAHAITTNRIAETAGVSIGSVYQYFSNKHAVFAPLHERHIGLVSEVIWRKIRESAEASLKELIERLAGPPESAPAGTLPRFYGTGGLDTLGSARSEEEHADAESRDHAA